VLARPELAITLFAELEKGRLNAVKVHTE